MTIRVYDLCGADNLRFSPYCARVRMALALKGLPYTTAAVAFTEIPAILDGRFKTVPVMEDGDTVVADSFSIAEYLDETKPGPRLFAGGAAGRAAARFVEASLFGTVHAQAMPLVALSIHGRLLEKDKAYFRQSREARLGRPLEEVCAGAEARVAEYRKVFQPLRQVLLRTPWLGGDGPLFVDAIAYGSLHWLHAVSDFDWFGGDDVLGGWFTRCRTIVAEGAALKG